MVLDSCSILQQQSGAGGCNYTGAISYRSAMQNACSKPARPQVQLVRGEQSVKLAPGDPGILLTTFIALAAPVQTLRGMQRGTGSLEASWQAGRLGDFGTQLAGMAMATSWNGKSASNGIRVTVATLDDSV